MATAALVNGLLVQGLPDENDNSSHPKDQIYMNGTATDTSDLLKSSDSRYNQAVDSNLSIQASNIKI
ncbi:hypothetical protein JTE90_000933 [Oedothorax gibbosus]|uniref:Uncharacterized protein n=1 Tax=Oedothorax gibbosus TaxID=931172 RepID=A0AAV6U301_9ARAC|nr:hypothetical protein JTE90_000933 [Oedothorax gibbosus]